MPPRNNFRRIESVFCREDLHRLTWAVSEEELFGGIGQHDQSCSGSEPTGDLLLNVGVAVRRRENLDEEVRCAREILAAVKISLAQAFVGDEGDVGRPDGVWIGRDLEASLGGQDAPELVLVDMGEEEAADLASDRAVFESGGWHPVEHSFDELVAPVIARHLQEVLCGEESVGDAHALILLQGNDAAPAAPRVPGRGSLAPQRHPC